jgi:hypothetical protein
MKAALLWIFIAASAVLFFLSLVTIMKSTAPDFSVYYGAVTYLFSGRSLYLGTDLATGIGYPPHTFLLLMPIAWLPLPGAQAIWVVLSVLAFIGCIRISLELAGVQPSALLLGISAAIASLAFPVRFTFGMGQSNFLALLFFLAGLQKVKTGKPIVGGVLIGIATIVKPHLIIIAMGMFLSRKWKAITAAVSTNATAVIFTGMFFGWRQFADYVSLAVPYMSIYRGREIYYNQGIRAIVSRFVPDQIAPQIILMVSITVLAVTAGYIVRRKFDAVRSCLLLIPVMLLVEPLAWQHHFVFLIPLMVYLATRLDAYPRAWLYALGYFLVGLNLDLAASSDRTFLGGMLQSHAGIGNMIVLFVGAVLL